MSYILDALRRADAERERGAVPGLHAKPLTIDAPADESAARRVPWLPIAVGATLALLGLAGLAWWLRPAVVVVPVPPAVIAAAPMPAPTAVQPPPVFVPPPPAPVAAPAPAVAAVPPPPAAPAKPRVEKVDKPQAVDKPEKAPARPAAAPAPPATPLAQLPPEVKRELPPMTVGGWIYSANAASRFVMINGQIVREGEPAATGVVLERIGPKSAILRWREWRIEVPL